MPQNEKNSAEGMGNKYEMGMDQYASLDPVAISCLIFGIFSAAAVFFPIFLFSSFFAFVLGISAIVRIKKSDGILEGRILVIAGMGLAVFFGAWQISGKLSREQTIRQASLNHALRWLEMIREGDLNGAHQLTFGFFDRVVPGTDLDEFYSEKKVQTRPQADAAVTSVMQDLSGTPFNQKTDLFRRPILTKIVDHGVDSKIEFVEHVTSFRYKKFVDYVIHKFKLVVPGEEDVFFDLTMKREAYVEPFGVQWAVDMIDNERTKVDRTRKPTGTE
ncbi:DUF4190 domain-containing protein [Pirellulaceae bacterium]|jgi:hypothetical protein|nr:hypothetical protein [Mariniblastus sp.]MDB4756383.1 DUF4190 domain-containing protein [Mariniblastus sp.]MDB4794159.1 DUF4190 domain-containing protein [Pirellulaceae bacterium]